MSDDRRPAKGPGSARSLPTSVKPGLRTRAHVVRANARPGQLHLADFARGASVLNVGDSMTVLLSYGKPIAHALGAVVHTGPMSSLSDAQARHLNSFASAISGETPFFHAWGAAFYRAALARDLQRAVSSFPTDYLSIDTSEET